MQKPVPEQADNQPYPEPPRGSMHAQSTSKGCRKPVPALMTKLLLAKPPMLPLYPRQATHICKEAELTIVSSCMAPPRILPTTQSSRPDAPSALLASKLPASGAP